MANCDELFKEYNDNISLTKSKKDAMASSKESLRDRIKNYFKENHSAYTPKFYIQGSYKMKTGIRTKDDICDLDDGIYFFREPDVAATTLQGWVWDAVNGYTDQEPEHREKCIRNIFTNDYEIDMPIYYKVEGEEYQLAVKDQGWEKSDPKALIKWFNQQKDVNGQLIRIVKYLKGWADHKRNRMPSGLAMTILACDAKTKIVYNDRDDITLKDTLKEIRKALKEDFKCIVPVVPGDDLFANYSETRRKNFLNALDKFIDDADNALREGNELKASHLWQTHLGDRFPDGKDEVISNSQNIGLIGGAKTSNPWAR
ncbi:MAG: cyclic GMP-AMP synthase DncV-like nucleotidyltransferase [Chitinophagaceae bacterium]